MKKNTLLNKINYFLLFLVILYVPFQVLLTLFLQYHGLASSITFWLAHWYEPLLVVLLLINVLVNYKKVTKNNILTFFLIVFGIASVLLLSTSVSRGLEGFRFSLFAILFFLLSSLSWIDLPYKKKIVNIYVLLAAMISIWAIIERILPLKYWSLINLINKDDVFGFGWHTVTGTLQSTGVFGGPNQLASYLLPAFFIILFSKEKINYKLTLIPIMAAITLSFSRSAFVGLVTGLLIYLFFFLRIKVIKFGVLFLMIIAACFSCFYYDQSQKFHDLLTHGASHSSHIEAFKTSVSEIKARKSEPTKLFFGSGIGSAGPAVIKYGDGYVSESWYLQLILEIGIVGLILWLGFIGLILKNLFIQKKYGLFLGLISVSVAALFLHTWADNPALSITLFTLLGLNIKNEEDIHEKNIN